MLDCHNSRYVDNTLDPQLKYSWARQFNHNGIMIHTTHWIRCQLIWLKYNDMKLRRMKGISCSSVSLGVWSERESFFSLYLTYIAFTLRWDPGVTGRCRGSSTLCSGTEADFFTLAMLVIIYMHTQTHTVNSTNTTVLICETVSL